MFNKNLTTLIGGAPSTLNDLNELAAAINDDANYNSTLTTALATKLPLAGGTMTGALNISGTSALSTEFKIGNLTWNQNSSSTHGLLHQYRGSDGYSELQINNTASSGAVTLNIRNDSASVATIANDGGAYFAGNVGIGIDTPDAKLRIDQDVGTVGLKVTGGSGGTNIAEFIRDVGATTTIGINGSGAEPQMYFTSTGNTFAMGVNGSNFEIADNTTIGTNSRLTIDTTGNVGIGTSNPQDTLHVVTDSATTNDTVDVVRIEATSSGTPVAGFGPAIEFRAERGNASADSVGRLGFVADNITASRVDGAFVAETAIDGAFTERLRISSSGNLLVGTTNTTWQSQEGLRYFNGSSLIITRDSDEPMNLNRLTSDGDLLILRKNGTPVGSIGVDGGSLAIGGGDVGIGFYQSANALVPYNGVTALRDAAIDLGMASGGRYKDAHFSGTVNSGSVTSSGQIKVTGSNASTVAFSVGDAGTGWYNAGSNAIALSSNGTPSIHVTSGGNVGIGTTNPAFKLVVAHNSRNGMEFVPNTDDAGTNIIQNYNRGTAAYTPLRIAGNSITLLSGTSAQHSTSIDTSGNIATSGNINLTGGGTIEAPSVGGGETLTLKAAGGITAIIDSNGNGGDGEFFRVQKHTGDNLLTVQETGAVEVTGTLNANGTLSATASVGVNQLFKSTYNYGPNRDWAFRTNNYGSSNWGGWSLEQSGEQQGTPDIARIGVHANGNVGIRMGGHASSGLTTVNPATALHVGGDITVGTAESVGTGAAAAIRFVNDNERARITSNYASGGGGQMGFWTDSTGGTLLQRAYIKNNGEVNLQAGLRLNGYNFGNSDVFKTYYIDGPSTNTITRTINVNTYFGFTNGTGGYFMMSLHGWQTDSAAGLIHWHNAGGSGIITHAYFQPFYTPTGLTVTVAKGTGTFDIDITLTGTHSNTHGWRMNVWG